MAHPHFAFSQSKERRNEKKRSSPNDIVTRTNNNKAKRIIMMERGVRTRLLPTAKHENTICLNESHRLCQRSKIPGQLSFIAQIRAVKVRVECVGQLNCFGLTFGP